MATTIKTLGTTPVYNDVTPFIPGKHIKLNAIADQTVYGVNHPGRSTVAKFQRFVQLLSGNKHFLLGSAVTAPQNTTGGALSDANQLRVVVLVNGVLKKRARGDQVAPASSVIVGAGGGTAVADATVIVKGTTAANILAGATTLSVASTGANTKTFLPGDVLTIAGDTTPYYATGAGTLTLNGATEILIGITPPLQVAAAASAVITVTAASGKGILVVDAPSVNHVVEVWAVASGDVATLSGGALTAGQDYDLECYDALVASGAVNMTALPL